LPSLGDIGKIKKNTCSTGKKLFLASTCLSGPGKAFSLLGKLFRTLVKRNSTLALVERRRVRKKQIIIEVYDDDSDWHKKCF